MKGKRQPRRPLKIRKNEKTKGKKEDTNGYTYKRAKQGFEANEKDGSKSEKQLRDRKEKK